MTSPGSHEERERQEREWRELGGKRLRATRKSAGLNQKQLAALAGTNQSTISDWERGNASPTVAQLAKLLNAMGYALKLTAERNTATGQTTAPGFAVLGPGRGPLKSRQSRK